MIGIVLWPVGIVALSCALLWLRDRLRGDHGGIAPASYYRRAA